MRTVRQSLVALIAALAGVVPLLLFVSTPAANADGPLSCDPNPHRIRAASGFFETGADGVVRAQAKEDPESVAQQFRVCTGLSWQTGRLAVQSLRNGRWLQPDLVATIRAAGVGEPTSANLFTITVDDSKLSVIYSVAAGRYLDARTDLPGTPVTATATGPKDWELVEITPEIQIPGPGGVR
jgi:hypothetical protein